MKSPVGVPSIGCHSNNVYQWVIKLAFQVFLPINETSWREIWRFRCIISHQVKEMCSLLQITCTLMSLQKVDLYLHKVRFSFNFVVSVDTPTSSNQWLLCCWKSPACATESFISSSSSIVIILLFIVIIIV